jgi:hypothetical protein
VAELAQGIMIIGFVLTVVLVAIALGIVALALFYSYIYARNKRLGTPGIMSRSRLTCPKCHETFDYDYVPGVSFTTVRLGAGRYMPCPKCRRWSYFNLVRTRIPRPENLSEPSR